MSIIVSGQRSPSGRLLHRWIGDAPIYGGGNPHAGAIRRGLSGQALMLGQGDPFHALWDPATGRRRRRRGVTNDPVRRPEDERPGPGPDSSSSDRVFISRSLSLSLLSSSIRARISISKDSSSLEVSNNLSLASSPVLESGERQFQCKPTAYGPYTIYFVGREY